ncbi:SIMPL domain-containing protein [Patescibacteria group bacterium]
MFNAKTILNLLLILAVTAIVIVALSISGSNNQMQDRFSVSGIGLVYAKADIANLSIGLKTEVKKTAADATQENSEKMNEIIKALKALDIEEKDIKTSDYRLNPVYNWTQARGQVLQGYEVYQAVAIKIRDLEKIGEIISKTAEKGANQIGNINFTIDDEYELKNEARELAIEKAKEKAKLIAKQAGMKLGSVKSVYENQNYQPATYNYANAKMEIGMGGGGEIDSPEIQTGQNEIRVEVTVTYEIK